MRIDTLYVERAVEAYATTEAMRKKFDARQVELIDDYQELFSRQKTPYLKKRENRNIFLAARKGACVKEAPPAYGYQAAEKHFYYVHAFNCIYECEYCYLQGYFSSPDLVLFVNHDDIIAAMERTVADHANERIWFHAGEFSDSLALSHITGELPLYFDYFTRHSQAFLELRTKSINIGALRALTPLPNIVVSFSLSTHEQAMVFDRETPSIEQRLSAMRRLSELGYQLGVHCDPIIYDATFAEKFEMLCIAMRDLLTYKKLQYVSLGVVRFAKDVFREAKSNYPNSQIFARHFIQGEDQKMRYVRPLRMQLLEIARAILKKHGCPEEKIYFCME
ncbi:MAG: hypothetical protein JSR44_12780 [Spirochaetes bacterium]|nr:hypothetical protein [Spirochaetota bacterium]